jgi:hypothetical protein
MRKAIKRIDALCGAMRETSGARASGVHEPLEQKRRSRDVLHEVVKPMTDATRKRMDRQANDAVERSQRRSETQLLATFRAGELEGSCQLTST